MRKKYLYIAILGLFLFIIVLINKSTSFAENNNLNSRSLFVNITSLTNEMFSINNGVIDQKSEKVLAEKANKRKELIKKIMREDPVMFNAVAMKEAKRNIFPSYIKENIETIATISGKIITVSINDLSGKNNKYQYYIITPKNRYSFHPIFETPFESGTEVKVTGYVIDDQISSIGDKDSIIKISNPPNIENTLNHQILVLLLKSFPESSEPFTPDEGYDLVFNGQFQNFMQEQSYNNISFDGDVFGWSSLNQQINSSCMNLSDAQLENIINAYNINFSNYQHVLLLLASTPAGGCSTVGSHPININNTTYYISQASIGLDQYDLPAGGGIHPFVWKFLDALLSHEIGHSLGVNHANNWLCEDGQILYGDCDHNEYGNFFDAMGMQEYSIHYNGYFKEKLGWIPDDKILQITQPGTYIINPLENIPGNKLAKIYIKDTNVSPYFVELRKGLGFDVRLKSPNLLKNQSGIFINRIESNSQNIPATELFDMSPKPIESLENVTLNLPSTYPFLGGINSKYFSFIDPGTGITIGPVTNVSDSEISFKVNLTEPTCVHFSPSIINLITLNQTTTGSYNYVFSSIRNDDYYGCGQSTFENTLVFPPEWQIDNQITNLYISPNNTGNLNLEFYTPEHLSPGSYTFSLISKNNSSGQTSTEYFTVEILGKENFMKIQGDNKYVPSKSFTNKIFSIFELIKSSLVASALNAFNIIREGF